MPAACDPAVLQAAEERAVWTWAVLGSSATHPALIGYVLGIVYRVIAGHLIRHAGYTQQSARTGAVTFIQPFGSALNLNIHFHMLFIDGVYVADSPHDNRSRPS